MPRHYLSDSWYPHDVYQQGNLLHAFIHIDGGFFGDGELRLACTRESIDERISRFSKGIPTCLACYAEWFTW